MHASIVLLEDPLDYSALFSEIADAYFELEMYSEAGPIYETLGSDPAVRRILDIHPFPLRCSYRQAVCIFFYKSPYAVECKVTYAKHLMFTGKVGLPLIMRHHEVLIRCQVIDADPSNTDAKMKLAELYEIMDEPRKALELVYQGTYFAQL